MAVEKIQNPYIYILLIRDLGWAVLRVSLTEFIQGPRFPSYFISEKKRIRVSMYTHRKNNKTQILWSTIRSTSTCTREEMNAHLPVFAVGIDDNFTVLL